MCNSKPNPTSLSQRFENVENQLVSPGPENKQNQKIKREELPSGQSLDKLNLKEFVATTLSMSHSCAPTTVSPTSTRTGIDIFYCIFDLFFFCHCAQQPQLQVKHRLQWVIFCTTFSGDLSSTPCNNRKQIQNFGFTFSCCVV